MNDIVLNVVSSILSIATKEPNVDDVHLMIDQLASGKQNSNNTSRLSIIDEKSAVPTRSCLGNTHDHHEKSSSPPSITPKNLIHELHLADDTRCASPQAKPVKSKGMLANLRTKLCSFFGTSSNLVSISNDLISKQTNEKLFTKTKKKESATKRKKATNYFA